MKMHLSRNIDWAAARRLVIEAAPAVRLALEKANTPGLAWSLHVPTDAEYGGAALTLCIWVPHQDGRRLVSQDAYATRCILLTNDELEAAGRLAGTAQLDGLLVHRAKRDNIRLAAASGDGFIWYKIVPAKFPEKVKTS